MKMLAVFLGAGLGGLGRYLVGVLYVYSWGISPLWATLSVNIIGSFLIGFLSLWLWEGERTSEFLSLFVMTGLLGGFTTFSTFSYDVIKLIEQGAYEQALIYSILSFILSIGSAFIGAYAMRTFVLT